MANLTLESPERGQALAQRYLEYVKNNPSPVQPPYDKQEVVKVQRPYLDYLTLLSDEEEFISNHMVDFLNTECKDEEVTLALTFVYESKYYRIMRGMIRHYVGMKYAKENGLYGIVERRCQTCHHNRSKENWVPNSRDKLSPEMKDCVNWPVSTWCNFCRICPDCEQIDKRDECPCCTGIKQADGSRTFYRLPCTSKSNLGDICTIVANLALFAGFGYLVSKALKS